LGHWTASARESRHAHACARVGGRPCRSESASTRGGVGRMVRCRGQRLSGSSARGARGGRLQWRRAINSGGRGEMPSSFPLPPLRAELLVVGNVAPSVARRAPGGRGERGVPGCQVHARRRACLGTFAGAFLPVPLAYVEGEEARRAEGRTNLVDEPILRPLFFFSRGHSIQMHFKGASLDAFFWRLSSFSLSLSLPLISSVEPLLGPSHSPSLSGPPLEPFFFLACRVARAHARHACFPP